MAIILILNTLAILYNVIMFYFEGGFNVIISSRLFWLGVSFLLLLIQINLITFGQIIRSIVRVRGFRRNDNEKITDYFKPVARYLSDE